MNKVRMNTDRAKIWKVIRGLLTFTSLDVAITSGASYENIKQYFRALSKAGYIRKEGKRGKEIIYRLIKNTGVKPPVAKTVYVVYDPNLNEVVFNERDIVKRNK